MAVEYVPYRGPIVTRDEARLAGLIWYFHGRPCARGHIAQRLTSNQQCGLCQQINISAWVKVNAEKVKADSKAYANKNLERIKEYKQKYYVKNRERLIANSVNYTRKNWAIRGLAIKLWQAANPERKLETQRKSRKRNAERTAAKTKVWRASNPEAARAKSSIYRARVRGAPGAFTSDDIKRIRKQQRGKCAYCRKLFGDGFHVDHIKAIARGGSNHPCNLQLTCALCNVSKGPRPAEVFARRMGLLL